MTAVRRRPGNIMLLLVTAALVLTACQSGEREPDREPYQVTDPLPVVDKSGMRLPSSFEDLEIVDPAWDTVPQYDAGVYLAGGEKQGVLEFTAVDVHGAVLWAVQRPVSCTGFALTTDAQGRVLAVLTDTQTTSEALATTTATAYEISSGQRIWGPVEVPGPHQGPGLVFGSPPQEFVGAPGPRTALDATSGRIVLEESAAEHARVVGEYHGTVLIVDDEALIAQAGADGSELWRIPLADYGWTASTISASLDASPAKGTALLTTAESTNVLLDLQNGAVLHNDVTELAVDAMTESVVIRDDAEIAAYDAGGQQLWTLGASTGTRIDVAGGAFLYLREQGAITVHNVLTGAVVNAYDPYGEGVILVPTHIAANGAALLSDGQRNLLATIPS